MRDTVFYADVRKFGYAFEGLTCDACGHKGEVVMFNAGGAKCQYCGEWQKAVLPDGLDKPNFDRLSGLQPYTKLTG